MKWISVKERFPLDTNDVLVFEKSTGMYVAYRSNCKWYAFTDGFEAYNDDGSAIIEIFNAHNITHWMPLPEPPEEV